MKLSSRNRVGINGVILSISLLAWVLLLVNPGQIMTIEHCHITVLGPSDASLQMLLEMNPFSSQIIGWGLMVVAMMLPKLIYPIQSVFTQSLKRTRFLHAVLFISGYVTVWMVAGLFMMVPIIGANLLMPMSFIPAGVVFTLAMAWQFSPIKQRCLNRGHEHPTLAAFGLKACHNSLRFGFMHGVWCFGAGWALMLFPMLLQEGHVLTMVLVTFIMISEHFEHPRYPQWHISLRLRLFRIIVAQTKMRLKALVVSQGLEQKT